MLTLTIFILDINQQKSEERSALEQKSDSINISDTKPPLYTDKCFFGRRSHEARASYYFISVAKRESTVGTGG